MFISKKVLYGCEGREGDNFESPYLTRYTLIERKNWQICLHIFHRSDYPDWHDHPWNFWTLILWQGYIENTPPGSKRFGVGNPAPPIKRRVWPGSILYRPAEHTHFVELATNKKGKPKPAITLVFMGKRKREWGFWLKGKFFGWVDYFIMKGC